MASPHSYHHTNPIQMLLDRHLSQRERIRTNVSDEQYGRAYQRKPYDDYDTIGSRIDSSRFPDYTSQNKSSTVRAEVHNYGRPNIVTDRQYMAVQSPSPLFNIGGRGRRRIMTSLNEDNDEKRTRNDTQWRDHNQSLHQDQRTSNHYPRYHSVQIKRSLNVDNQIGYENGHLYRYDRSPQSRYPLLGGEIGERKHPTEIYSHEQSTHIDTLIDQIDELNAVGIQSSRQKKKLMFRRQLKGLIIGDELTREKRLYHQLMNSSLVHNLPSLHSQQLASSSKFVPISMQNHPDYQTKGSPLAGQLRRSLKHRQSQEEGNSYLIPSVPQIGHFQQSNNLPSSVNSALIAHKLNNKYDYVAGPPSLSSKGRKMLASRAKRTKGTHSLPSKMKVKAVVKGGYILNHKDDKITLPVTHKPSITNPIAEQSNQQMPNNSQSSCLRDSTTPTPQQANLPEPVEENSPLSPISHQSDVLSESGERYFKNAKDIGNRNQQSGREAVQPQSQGTKLLAHPHLSTLDQLAAARKRGAALVSFYSSAKNRSLRNKLRQDKEEALKTIKQNDLPSLNAAQINEINTKTEEKEQKGQKLAANALDHLTRDEGLIENQNDRQFLLLINNSDLTSLAAQLDINQNENSDQKLLQENVVQTKGPQGHNGHKNSISSLPKTDDKGINSEQQSVVVQSSPQRAEDAPQVG